MANAIQAFIGPPAENLDVQASGETRALGGRTVRVVYEECCTAPLCATLYEECCTEWERVGDIIPGLDVLSFHRR